MLIRAIQWTASWMKKMKEGLAFQLVALIFLLKFGYVVTLIVC